MDQFSKRGMMKDIAQELVPLCAGDVYGKWSRETRGEYGGDPEIPQRKKVEELCS
jgi:hypothetical protein